MKRIAIGTDDKVNLCDKHFGMSRYFIIYDVDENDNYIRIEERENPYFGDNHRHAETDEIMKVLSDCQVFIGKAMGKESQKRIKEEWGKTSITARNVNTVGEAIELYVKNEL
ncbi:MAG: hypothetical protein PWR08_1261 [Thermoanaerobacterium sp.]|nr:hypothetical protein [Thermoanaerobacterium sp.]